MLVIVGILIHGYTEIELVHVEVAHEEQGTQEVQEVQENQEEQKNQSSIQDNSNIQHDTIMKYGGYTYNQLSEGEQALYEEIFCCIEGLEKEVRLVGLDQELVSYVFNCVMVDHPEFFYLEGFSGTTERLKEQIVSFTFSPIYTMTATEIQEYNQINQIYLEDCKKQIPNGASEYEVVKSVYEYIILHTDYEHDAILNQTICSVTANGASVCQGYAKTMQYLLNEFGIFATIVFGTAQDGEAHAWNLVSMDGEYYYVDCTGGDPLYEQETQGSQETISYDYLGLTTKQVEETYEINHLVPLPECVATENNYYQKEGLYFTEYDLNKLQMLFKEGEALEKDAITFQCASTSVYEEMMVHLLDEQVIFSLIESPITTVAFTNDDQKLILTFYLE